MEILYELIPEEFEGEDPDYWYYSDDYLNKSYLIMYMQELYFDFNNDCQDCQEVNPKLCKDCDIHINKNILRKYVKENHKDFTECYIVSQLR